MDGGLRSPLYPQFWKADCPSKVTLFCWLAREDKISTLSNLSKKGCNIQCATDTCVLCHKNSETAEHLLLNCEFSERIWHFFGQILDLQSHPQSLLEVWTSWIPSIESQQQLLWDLLSRAIFWSIWFERNNRIFNLNVLSPISIIIKAIHLLLAWIFAARDPHQHFPSDSLQNLRRSLDFLSARSADQAGSTT